MRKVWLGGLVGVLGAVLSACGGGGVPRPAGGAAPDPYTYVLDGAPSTAEAVLRLSEGSAPLVYFMGAGGAESTVHVFTTETGFQAFKRREDERLAAQGFCVSLRTKTTVYEYGSYNFGHLDFLKGTSITDLATLPRSGGLHWGDAISSIKMADCVYTRLYTGTNYTGSSLVRKGDNLSSMPAGFDETISSLKVDP